MGQRGLRDAVITISDGTAAPEEVVVKIGSGNFTFTEHRTVEYIRDRGVIDTVRLGDEEPVDVSFDFVWDWISSDTMTTDLDSIIDILKGVTGYTTTGGTCEPYACDIELVVSDAICAGEETITLADFRYEELSYDLSAGTISCTGKCNISGATIATTSTIT